MRIRLPALCVTLALLATGCGPSSSSEDRERHEAAIAALRPGMARVDAIRAALPAPADAREVPLAAPLPAEGLETVDARRLDVIFGAPEDPEARPFTSLSTDAMRTLGLSYLEPVADPTFAHNVNLELRVEALAATRHVVVYRTTELDEGEIGRVTGKDTFEIKRPAVWKGWVFAYAFEDPPRLVAAFPTEARSSDRLTTVVHGDAPSTFALVQDALFQLNRDTLRRLTGG